MTPDRAITIARAIMAAGYIVELSIAPARLPVDARAGATPELGNARVPLDHIGRRLTLDDLEHLRRELAQAGARGELEPGYVRILDGAPAPPA